VKLNNFIIKLSNVKKIDLFSLDTYINMLKLNVVKLKVSQDFHFQFNDIKMVIK